MEEAQATDRRFLAAGFALSLLIHVLVAMALAGWLVFPLPSPEVQPIEVELVAPPEAETPAAEVPEEEPQVPEQEEAEQEEAEQPAAPPPPPPPPQQPEEQVQADSQQVPPPAVLQPVTEFGEEDTGPQGGEEDAPAQAETQSQTEDAQTEPEETAEAAAAQESASDLAQEPADAPEAEEVAQEDEAASEPEAGPETETEAETEAEAGETGSAPDAEPEVAALEEPGTEATRDVSESGELPAEDFGTVGPIVTDAVPASKPARRAAAVNPQPSGQSAGQNSGQNSGQSTARRTDLLPARELYSRDILDDERARTAMRGMPEGQRLNLLCMTELRAQLSAVSPAPPELLPSFRPRPGTVLEPGRAAFRSLGRWYDLAFRCETNGDVTRVERFSFRIGEPIPPSQWAERGLSGF